MNLYIFETDKGDLLMQHEKKMDKNEVIGKLRTARYNCGHFLSDDEVIYQLEKLGFSKIPKFGLFD